MQDADVRMPPAGAGTDKRVAPTPCEWRAHRHVVGKEWPTAVVAAHHDASIFWRHYRALEPVHVTGEPCPRRPQANSLQLLQRHAARLSDPQKSRSKNCRDAIGTPPAGRRGI